VFIAAKEYKYKQGYDNIAVREISAPLPKKLKHLGMNWPAPQFEVLKAWNPITQKEVWRAACQGTQNGGVLSTNGNLVFQGSSTGNFLVYRADNGEKLKEIEVGTGIQAAPITYEIAGEQYVAVMAGYGGAVLIFPGEQDALNKYQNAGRIIAFKLNGTKTPLPPEKLKDTIVPEPPAITLNQQMIDKGEEIYYSLCYTCHVSFGKSHLNDMPNLSMMSKPTHESFSDILLKGKLSYNGMADFSDILTPEDVEALHQFLISVQKEKFEKKK